MSLYKKYPAHQVFLRRALVIVAGIVALPVMLLWKDRARFYSYLHRVWSKTSEKPPIVRRFFYAAMTKKASKRLPKIPFGEVPQD